jgi:hypothetical protein
MLHLAIILLLSSQLSVSGSGDHLTSPISGHPALAYASSYQVQDDRLQLRSVGSELKLAEPNRIDLDLHGYRVRSAYAEWASYHGTVKHPLDTEPDSLAVMYDQNGQAYVNVTPLRLGRVELRVLIDFEDGASASARIDLQVVAPDRSADNLVVATGLGYGRIEPVIYLDLRSDRSSLFPALFYKGISQPVPIDAQYVTFMVLSSPGTDPPIEVDAATGAIKPLRIGHALVETRFQDLSALTCVNVVGDARFRSTTDCKELLPPGRSLPAQPWANDPTPPKPVESHPR